jgi:undecaprenyl-diphosphatase
MLGATVFDLSKDASSLDAGNGAVIGIGFVAAFLAALVIVRTAIAFIGRHGFVPFAWYRIAVGAGMIGVLLLC